MAAQQGFDLLRTGAAAVLAAGLISAGAALAADTAVPHLPSGLPDFSSANMGWASNGVEFLPMPGPGSNR